MGAGEGEGDDEYLITRIECFSPALNIINCYGEQRKIKKGRSGGEMGKIGQGDGGNQGKEGVLYSRR